MCPLHTGAQRQEEREVQQCCQGCADCVSWAWVGMGEHAINQTGR